ncbi:MAG: virulence RhuM family protein, partial [Alphaproteobacteria bacterium]|nr:virulence RhuM family protein [Alphaproteobacteria bacterium]
LEDWRDNVDRFIAFNERPVLEGPGRISHESMAKIAHDRYESFDRQRKRDEAVAADAEDIAELAAIAAKAARRP